MLLISGMHELQVFITYALGYAYIYVILLLDAIKSDVMV